MPENKIEKEETKLERISLTARLHLNAYDAIAEIQRRYRRRTGRHKPLWKVLDAAIIAYAKKQGFNIGEQTNSLPHNH